jgi:hypothetical protein
VPRGMAFRHIAGLGGCRGRPVLDAAGEHEEREQERKWKAMFHMILLARGAGGDRLLDESRPAVKPMSSDGTQTPSNRSAARRSWSFGRLEKGVVEEARTRCD